MTNARGIPLSYITRECMCVGIKAVEAPSSRLEKANGLLSAAAARE